MPVLLLTRRQNRWTKRFARLNVESLESRFVPAGPTWPGLQNPILENGVNDTLDKAQDLGGLTATPRAEAVGNIGSGAAGKADVDFYRFSLTSAANVHLATLDQQAGSSFVS